MGSGKWVRERVVSEARLMGGLVFVFFCFPSKLYRDMGASN